MMKDIGFVLVVLGLSLYAHYYRSVIIDFIEVL